MSFSLSEVVPPASVTTAALIPNFDISSYKYLAIGSGNRLLLYPIQEEITTDKIYGQPIIKKLNGQIMKVLPIEKDICSLILVILKDLRACVLSYNYSSGTIATDLTGNLQCDHISDDITDIKCRISPSALVIQRFNQLVVFPIISESDNTTLGVPFPITFASKTFLKRIVDFVFVGPIRRATRIAVLTEEESKFKLRLIEISTSSFKEDPIQTIELEDTYFIIGLLPSVLSHVLTFSSFQATMIEYASGIEPKRVTKTIFTQYKIAWYVEMADAIYAIVDQRGMLRIADFSVDKPIRIKDTNIMLEKPTDLIRISDSVFFYYSNSGRSGFYTITKNDKGQYAASPLGETVCTGGVLGFVKHEHCDYVICTNSIVCKQMKIQTKELKLFTCSGLTGIFGGKVNGTHRIIVTTRSKSHLFDLVENKLVPSKIDTFINDEITILAQFYDDGLLQVTPSRIVLRDGQSHTFEIVHASIFSGNIVLCTQKAALLINEKGETLHQIKSTYTLSAINDKYIALVNYLEVTFYDLTFNSIDVIKLELIPCSIGFDGDTLICVYSNDYISMIKPHHPIKSILIPGFYSSMCFYSGRPLILGDNSYLIDDTCLYQICGRRYIGGTVIDDTLYGICSEGILLSSLHEKTPYISYRKTIHRMTHMCGYRDICIYLSDRCLYIQSNMIAAGKMVPTDDFRGDIIGLTAFDRLVMILTNRFLYASEISSTSGLQISRMDIDQDPVCIGTFNDMLYLGFADKIEFNACERDRADRVSLVKTCKIMLPEGFDDKFHKITHASGMNDLFTVVTGSKRAYLYKYHSIDKSFDLIASCEMFFPVSVIGILGSSVLAGSVNGIISIFQVSSKNNEYKLTCEHQTSIGSCICCIQPGSDALQIGTVDGAVYRIQEVIPPKDFDSVYSVIETKMFSLGHFSKFQERSIIVKNRILQTQSVIDLDLLSEFKSLLPESQSKILENTKFSRDLVLQLIYNLCEC